MGAIGARLAKLEAVRAVQETPPWQWRELRQIGPDLWQDPDGNEGTQEALAALTPDRTIIVMLPTE